MPVLTAFFCRFFKRSSFCFFCFRVSLIFSSSSSSRERETPKRVGQKRESKHFTRHNARTKEAAREDATRWRGRAKNLPPPPLLLFLLLPLFCAISFYVSSVYRDFFSSPSSSQTRLVLLMVFPRWSFRSRSRRGLERPHRTSASLEQQREKEKKKKTRVRRAFRRG